MTSPAYGVIFNRDSTDPRPAQPADLSVIGLVLPSDDADATVFPLNEPVAFDSGAGDPLQKIRALGDGYGVDLVADTAGPSETLALSMAAARPGGRIVKIGWGPGPVGFSLDPLLTKSLTLRGHFSHTWDVWEKSLALMASGKVDLGPLVTHELPLDTAARLQILGGTARRLWFGELQVAET